MITTVTNSAQLIKALKAAKNGDTIRLAAGTYASVAITGLHFTTGVTIVSADPTHQAVLSNLSVTNSSGLNFQQVNLTATTGTAATLTGSSSISFSQDTFSGNSSSSSTALMLKTSSGVSVTGSSFANFGKGINAQTDGNLTISNNTFHGITSGAVVGTAVTNSTISNNTFTDASSAVPAHTDVLNLSQNNTTNKVTISGNFYGPPLPSVITNTAQLLEALQNAHGGEVFKLAAGTYSAVAISSYNFPSAVTITSADPAHQAVFTNLTVSNSSGLTFQGVTLNTATGTAATVSGASNIAFNGDTFSGSGAGGAMQVTNSSGVKVTGSDFGNFATGINLLTDSNLAITNNTFHGITGGAIRGTSVTNSTVSNNTFTDASTTVPTHTDVLYLWQDNVANNVTVSGNFYGPPLPSVLTTTTQLIEALQNAHAGDVIHLAAGVYDAAAISGMQFATAVTITSADPTHEAVLTNLNVSNSSGLTFQGVTVGATTGTAATVTGSQAITFSGDTFSGSAAGTGAAMQVSGSSGVTVTGSDFGKFATGINATTDSNLSVTNNTFHDITGGDVFGSGVTNSAITGNSFANASATNAAHTDVLNLAQDNTANNVTISGNTYPAPPVVTPPAGIPSGNQGSSPAVLTNAQLLVQALQNAHAGDVIKLAAGAYDGAVLNNLNFASDVTITSADPTHEAVISNLTISNSSGLLLEGVNLTTGSGTTAATVTGSQNVTFSGDTFTGVGTGTAVAVSGSSNVAVTGSDIGNFGTGLNLQTDSNVTVSGNNFHGNPGGGVVGSGVTASAINGNTFPDASSVNTAHTDVINLAQDNTANQVEINGNAYGSAHVVQVSNAQQLMSALSSAHAGDVIELAAGNYSSLSLNGFNFTAPVTIMSADPDNHAVFQDLTADYDSGITFADVTFSTASGTAVTVGADSNMVFSHDTFTGPGAAAGGALMLVNSTGVTVTGSDFGHLNLGVIVGGGDNNVALTGNTFHDMGGQDVYGSGLTNATISGNTFANASASVADHTDAVYLWQDMVANHVTVSNNVYGAGGAPQQPAGSTDTTSSSGTTSGTTTNVSLPTTPVGGGSSGGGNVVTVTTGQALMTALQNAHAGDIIQLSGGAWGDVNLSNIHFDSGNVHITSADQSNEAMLTSMTLTGCSGLSIDHLNVAIPATNGSNYAVTLGGDTNVSLSDMSISGPSGGGVLIRNSSGITVTHSDLGNLGVGMSIVDNSNITVSGNSVHDITGDGIDSVAVTNEVLSGNTFADFYTPDGVHPDAMQFWGDSTGGCSNVLVEDNVLTRGNGNQYQGVFIQGGDHFEIVGNALVGLAANGVVLGGVVTGLVTGNFVEGFPDTGGSNIITRAVSSNVSVVGNTDSGVVNIAEGGVANPGYVESGNTTIPLASVGDYTAMNAWLAQHSPSTASLSDSFFLH